MATLHSSRLNRSGHVVDVVSHTGRPPEQSYSWHCSGCGTEHRYGPQAAAENAAAQHAATCTSGR
ncbi:hypothetical protein Kpho02_72930 [Kitasatospora phosalacinea]|uniref:Uncharacterized protein n=1 Tax=Kitasatospora phosalacinea TaxID=2065 RepID=A0A9W6QG49_9ACTN|nr:hypothetical protein [Kitasatospora phosalacinea]GLW74996.1 hypothetical protein Kpho02_72930 [Kitasatospora phosalacinea]